MGQLTAKPQVLKQANLSMIRRVIKKKGTATRAEITAETNISSTTVRSLLHRMLQNGEIVSIGYDDSSGGRKAERYGFSTDRYYSVALCMSGCELHAVLINIYGEILDITTQEIQKDNYLPAMFSVLDELAAHKKITAIGLGVPGIVQGSSYWRKVPGQDNLVQEELGTIFSKRYGVPVVLENDINATAIGFGLCYEKDFPSEKPECTNMAYIHFEGDCISAGFIADGKIIRGFQNFAGELGLVPVNMEKLLDEFLNKAMEDSEYIQTITLMLGFICGILNPQYIALSGEALRKDCIGSIGSLLSSFLPREMAAEILYSPDVWNDYHMGMAYLTANKMFDEIVLIKE